MSTTITRDDVACLARQAGNDWIALSQFDREFLFRFAVLVASKQQELAAQSGIHLPEQYIPANEINADLVPESSAKPVAWIYEEKPWYDGKEWRSSPQASTSESFARSIDKNYRPLYEGAKHSRWIGLTKRDVMHAIHPLCHGPEGAQFLFKVSIDEYRAIESALREKNKGRLPEWVGLTDEDVLQAIRPLCKEPDAGRLLLERGIDEYRAIESALREKNCKQA